MCFNRFFYAFGTRFQSFWSRSFARNDISRRVRTECWTKLFSDSHFISIACFFDIISSMFPHVLEKYLYGTAKICVFKNIYPKSSVFSIRTPVKDAGFI